MTLGILGILRLARARCAHSGSAQDDNVVTPLQNDSSAVGAAQVIFSRSDHTWSPTFANTGRKVGHPPDMKFALLHIDQAIELLLKERVRKSGNSIYKNPKETISIWGAYEILENKVGCKFPEKPDLELLHEERNNIQHKYSNPDADDAAFHVECAMKFIERFTRDELGLVLADFLPSEFIAKVLSP